jgi:hypothetical protein
MDVAEIGPGLYRWTARHPDWRRGSRPESTGDWPAEVGSVAYLAPGALVVIDPLTPAGEPGFWDWLDGLAARRKRRVHVLTTIKFHRRSRDEVAGRYGAPTSRARGRLPSGVEAIPIRGMGETMFWIGEHRALVPGDRIIGAGGVLRPCPESWLGYLGRGVTLDDLRQRLRPLLELPIEAVLVSHGEPATSDGRDALAAALAH